MAPQTNLMLALRPRPALASSLLFHAAQIILRRQKSHRPDVAQTTSETAYRDWRRSDLASQLEQHFDVSALRGREVLDFGCGTGELSFIIRDCGARRVIGVDMSASAIATARETPRRSEMVEDASLQFVHSTLDGEVPVDDACVDLVCCFDVLEHIADVPAILAEWRRVLRPHGRVWIWWSPWRNPFGHHLRSLIPLPWVHLLFSEAAMVDACARVYDGPYFIPRKWDIDASTGNRKPNKWRSGCGLQGFLNRLTRREFERMIRDAGFAVIRCAIHGFSGSGARRAIRWAARLPMLGECFTSFFVYELSRGHEA